jgi:starch-binding outer membrane protein, SusD/RagB family
MKFYKFILLAALLLPFTSCKDFLDEEVVNTLTQDYYKTPEGLESLCNGCYKILRYKGDYNQGEYLFGSGSDVEVFCWSLADRIVNGSYSSDSWGASVTTGARTTPHINNLIGAYTNTTSVKYTEGAYPSIAACNSFLYYYNLLSAENQTKLAIRKGEVLFLRAYSYYLITNQIGAAPLILEPYMAMPENYYFPKASLETIYDQLISDMSVAVGLLPATVYAAASGNMGRVNKMAAAHFLSKLYLNRAQAAGWENSSETHLKMLYKGNHPADLDSCISLATVAIDALKSTNAAYGGLATDFGALWLNDGTLSRDNQKEIILSAQYEPTQEFNGRYGDASGISLTHVYNSNHTTANAGILRDFSYGRPYATLMPSDWAYDQFTDRANDSRYYKSFLINYKVTATDNSGKPWDAGSAYYYNNVLKGATDPAATVTTKGRMTNGNVGLVYIENSKDQPLDSLWVMSHPYVMNVRWMVGSPNNTGYFTKSGSTITGFQPGAQADPNNPVIANYVAEGRKIYYRLSGTNGSAYGIDRGLAVSQWYAGTNKWLDKTRGKGTNANGSQSFDTPIFRLAETYLIRAEAYGRRNGGGDMALAIADLNVLRKRAAYHAAEKRDPILVTAEAAVLSGALAIPADEKVAPYTVATDSYNSIRIDGSEWTGGTAKARLENYPPSPWVTTDADRFIHFIYNERGRELIFELTNFEDLHNAGILYERVYYRDMLGAPTTSTGTVDFPFPTDDIGGTGTVGAKGVGKGSFTKSNTFKAWPTAFLQLLTDENNVVLDVAGQAAYQNPGY